MVKYKMNALLMFHAQVLDGAIVSQVVSIKNVGILLGE